MKFLAKTPIKALKMALPPRGRVMYSDLRHYIVKRGPRLINQIIGRDLRYCVQIRRQKEHMGSRHHGKSICPTKITRDSIVYSFGIGRNISFDLSMIEKFEVTIYAFDPTPGVTEWLKSKSTKRVSFFEYGIADYDGFAEFYPLETEDSTSTYNYTMVDALTTARSTVKREVYKLETIMNRLGNQKIDILKIDIEGAEYAVIDDFLASDIEIDQLLVEFHHRFERVGISKTEKAIKSLNEKGFKIFRIAPDGEEYSFIRV